jgi:hypothetical protein
MADLLSPLVARVSSSACGWVEWGRTPGRGGEFVREMGAGAAGPNWAAVDSLSALLRQWAMLGQWAKCGPIA